MYGKPFIHEKGNSFKKGGGGAQAQPLRNLCRERAVRPLGETFGMRRLQQNSPPSKNGKGHGRGGKKGGSTKRTRAMGDAARLRQEWKRARKPGVGGWSGKKRKTRHKKKGILTRNTPRHFTKRKDCTQRRAQGKKEKHLSPSFDWFSETARGRN